MLPMLIIHPDNDQLSDLRGWVDGRAGSAETSEVGCMCRGLESFLANIPAN
jgi:hypothetical protein